MKKIKIGILVVLSFLMMIVFNSCSDHEHTYKTIWDMNSEYHYHPSSCGHEVVSGKALHEFGEGVITKEATEEENGIKTYTCKVCNYQKEESIDKLSHEHKFLSTWDMNSEYHYHSSSCGHEVVSGKALHEFDEGVITKEATEEENGIKTYTCKVCNYQKEESIDQLSHEHKFLSTWDMNSEYHYHSSSCGHEVVSGKALHEFGEGVITKEATEEENGIKTYTCKVCNYQKEESIDKLSHEHKFLSTWDMNSEYHYHSSSCGHEVVSGKALHEFNEGVITKEATEEENGIKTYTCKVCNYQKEESIDKLSHEHKFLSTWDMNSEYHYHPSSCGHEVVSGKALHEFNEGVITKAPTVSNKGTKEYTCKVCSYIKIEELETINIDSLHINAYNTQGSTTGFAQYDGLMLYKKGVTLGSSLYWHKVAIKIENEKYVVKEIASSGSSITVDYDYLLLSYSYDKSGMYEKLVAYDFQIGEIVSFSQDLNSLTKGSVSLEVSRITSSSTYDVTYELGFKGYDTKYDLYVDFFTDFYNFIMENTDCDMESFGITNVNEFLVFCQTWDANGRSELAGVGNAFGSYFLEVEENGTFKTQPITKYVGYCYHNNKYIDLLEHLEVFFGYWRTDEGYSQNDPHGNDFFYSSWAAFVDTCKFFYFTSETLTSKYAWFTYERSTRVHYMLDHVPNVMNLSLQEKEDSGKVITLPNIVRMGYEFLGWYNQAEGGNRVYQVSQTMTVYARFKRIIHTVTFMDGGTVIKEVEVKDGLKVQPLTNLTKGSYLFKGFVNQNFETYDFLNAINDDMILFARWESSQEIIGTLTVNAYNTQEATNNYSAYYGLELFKGGVSIGSSLYWYKVGLLKDGNNYIINEIAVSGKSLAKSYDYILLSYSNEKTGMYQRIIELGLQIGDKVAFNKDLSNLSKGEINVQVTFERGMTPIHMLILDSNGVENFQYEGYYIEDEANALPIPSKVGYSFDGWYDNSNFEGTNYMEVPTNFKNDLILYAKWIVKEDASVLDFVSDVVTSYTKDELPQEYEGATLEWLTSNANLYTIENNFGYTNRRYQTHQFQQVTVSVIVTKNGHSETLSKQVTINPVLFDDMNHPKAVYFAVSSISSYQQYNERYLTEGTLFSNKFKENMNMVYYAFAIPQEDGTLSLNTKYINEVMELKNHGIRVTLVIDGANATPLKAMVKLCNDDLTRAKFVDNIVKLVTTYNFDGVDVDWEFPGVLASQSGYSEYTTAVDRANLNKLLRDLRAKFNTIQDSNGSNFILSVATPPTYWGTDRYDYDGRYSNGVGGINDYCDYVNMMSYDLNKDSSTSHLSHVFTPSNSYSYSFCCEYGINYYTRLGLDKSKIILGAAAYGKAYKITGTVNESATYPGLGVAGTRGQVVGYDLPGQSITWNSGTIYYTGIKKLMNNNNFKLYHEYNSKGQFVGSYLYNSTDKYFITFDSEQAVIEKCKLAAANEGMGIMVWAYGEDATDTIVNAICDNL